MRKARRRGFPLSLIYNDLVDLAREVVRLRSMPLDQIHLLLGSLVGLRDMGLDAQKAAQTVA